MLGWSWSKGVTILSMRFMRLRSHVLHLILHCSAPLQRRGNTVPKAHDLGIEPSKNQLVSLELLTKYTWQVHKS